MIYEKKLVGTAEGLPQGQTARPDCTGEGHSHNAARRLGYPHAGESELSREPLKTPGWTSSCLAHDFLSSSLPNTSAPESISGTQQMGRDSWVSDSAVSRGGDRSNYLVFLGKLERAKGFEPSTPTLARLCSTPELRPL